MNRFFTQTQDRVVYLLGDLSHHLFNPCRVDSSIRNQALHRLAGDLPSYRVKARQENRSGRIVDQDGHAGSRLKGADIPALSTDNPAFDILPAGQGDTRRRVFKCVLSRVPLNGKADNAFGFILGFDTGLFQNMA